MQTMAGRHECEHIHGHCTVAGPSQGCRCSGFTVLPTKRRAWLTLPQEFESARLAVNLRGTLGRAWRTRKR